MEKTSLVIEHDFDQTTLDELQILRDVRLGLAAKQLKSPEATIDEMIRRGIISSKERSRFVKELKVELEHKMTVLTNRQDKDNIYYLDEINLYSDLLPTTVE